MTRTSIRPASTANPFYATRTRRTAPPPMPDRPGRRYALLPQAPVTASPVPELTSLYHNADPGPWATAATPGTAPAT